MNKELKKMSKAELVEKAKAEIEAKKNTKTTPPAAPVSKESKEKTAVVNIDEIRGKLPTRVSTKDLCVAFGYTDGGKQLRKVLRAKFAAPSKHEKKADWVWNKGDKVLDEILAYFAKTAKPEVVVAQ